MAFVPEPVKQLFDQFPLKQYPPVQQLTRESRQALQQRCYSFSSKPTLTGSTTTPPNVHFKLAVYNVFKHSKGVYLASDPLCLHLELLLATSNSLSLPGTSNPHRDPATTSSLFVVSHRAAEDGQLPFYIEEQRIPHRSNSTGPAGGSTSTVRPCNDALAAASAAAHLSSATETVLAALVNGPIYDYWLTSVLYEFDELTQQAIHQLHYKEPSRELANRLSLPQLLQQLIARNGFQQRNPHIAAHFNSVYNLSFSLTFTSKASLGVQQERQRNESECCTAISSLVEILTSRGTRFFTGDTAAPGALDTALASYSLLAEHYAPNSTFAKVLLASPVLASHAESVLEYCI